MDVQAQRLQNLHAILKDRFESKVARLAKAIGKDPNQTRFILNPDKPGGRKIGEKLARQIEERLELERHMLDQAPPQAGYAQAQLSDGQLQLKETVAEYLASIPDEMAKSLATLIESAARK